MNGHTPCVQRKPIAGFEVGFGDLESSKMAFVTSPDLKPQVSEFHMPVVEFSVPIDSQLGEIDQSEQFCQ